MKDSIKFDMEAAVTDTKVVRRKLSLLELAGEFEVLPSKAAQVIVQ